MTIRSVARAGLAFQCLLWAVYLSDIHEREDLELKGRVTEYFWSVNF